MEPPHFVNPSWEKRYTIERDAKRGGLVKKNKNKRAKVNAFNTEIPVLKPKRDFVFVYRFLQFLVISLSTLTCSYQTYDRFSFFLSKPTDTRVRLIRNSSVKFPSITLCPAANNHVPLDNIRTQQEKIVNLLQRCALIPRAVHTLNISTLWQLMSLDGTLHKVYEYSRSNMIPVEKQVLNPHPSFVKSETETALGTCYTYYTKDLIRFQKDDFRLVFELYNHLINCSRQYGITRFMLHQDDAIVKYKIVSGYTHLQLSDLVRYGLTAKRFKILNRTSNVCDTIQVVNQCEVNCFENVLKNVTRCRFPLAAVTEAPLCKVGGESGLAIVSLFKLAISFNYLKECNCPKICDETLYTDHLKMMKQSDNLLSKISIHFDGDVIEEIEEYYSYGFISFICDIGGNLGLFLGLSIPGMFELAKVSIAYSFKHLN